VGCVVVEGGLHQAAHRFQRRQLVQAERAFGVAHAAVGLLQHGGVQPLLAAEVVVDHPLGGAGAGGDVVHPAAGVALLAELSGGGGEYVAPGLVGVAGAARRGGFGDGPRIVTRHAD
jgi:hypothetical protein